MGPLTEVLLCSSVSGAGWASLSIVLLLMLAVGREEMVTAPPAVCDSAVSSSFPPQAFPTTVSSLTSAPSISPSQQQPSPRDCSTVPKPQLPATAQVHGTCIPVRGVYGCGKGCLILIPFRLPQISCLTLSLKCFYSESDNCLIQSPLWGLDPCFKSPTCQG